MSNDRQLNYVNNLQNRDQKLYYVDDASELNSINLKENDKIYAINDNKLFQMEIADQEEELSGPVVSFNGRNNTKIKSLVANIEPQQDLHGYDHPWPGGGNVNIGNFVYKKGINTQGIVDNISGRAATITPIKIEDGKNYYVKAVGINPLVIIAVWNGDSLVRRVAGINLNTALDVSDGTDLYVCVYESEASKHLVGVDENQLMIVTDNSVTTYSPYSNICPISGWTGCEVVANGANLWDEEWEPGRYNASGNPTTEPGIRSKNFIPIPVGTTSLYVHVGSMTTNDIRILMYREDKSVIALGGWWVPNKPLIVYPDARYLKFFTSSGGYGTTYKNDISINYPVTETQYNTARVISVNWEDEAGTVYGGTLTLNPDRTGTLVVDKATVDMGTIGWNQRMINGVNRICSNEISNILTPASDFVQPNAINEVYKMVVTSLIGSADALASIGTDGYSYGKRLIINDSRITQPEQAAGILSGYKFLYHLKTPQVIQLTAEQVSGILTTLYGANNVWSDTGDITVKIAEKGITAFELEPHI